ncbi:ferrous iron transport protein B [Caldivirga sp. MU80]|uniref:ferrous iron transport protein B n=1 Tax=Caldivirga sp. MU80 TaxID=1650354 RepID=UPI000832CB86|nr:ferrous iron transport protein B [Caldivirga sp. MU80]
MDDKYVRRIKIGVVGLPNSGKSTIVSSLSGLFIRTANYPGTTVSINVVNLTIKNLRIQLIDLPGIYSLSSEMPDEEVATKEILRGNYDGFIVVGSTLSLQQTIYLLVQLLELGKPVILVLNMMDLARKQGININVEAMRRRLGIPIIPSVAASGVGMGELRKLITEIAQSSIAVNTKVIDYGPLEKYIDAVSARLNAPRGLAIEVLKGNDLLKEERLKAGDIVSKAIEEIGQIDVFVARKRWDFVSSITKDVVARGVQVNLSKLDYILLNPKVGILASLALLFTLAEVIFLVLNPLVNYISELLSMIPIGELMVNVGNPLIRSFIMDAVWNSTSIVLSFIPYVFGVALIIAFIEDSGLIIRLTFPLEKWLRRIGLPSRGLIYLIAGVGCNVPATSSTVAIPSSTDRLITALMIPYIPCMARLLVISLIAAAILPSQLTGVVMILPFVTSLIGVMVMSRLLLPLLTHIRVKLTARVPYAYELPQLIIPINRFFVKKVWHYTYEFLVRAGILIVAFSALMWVLSISGPSGLIGPEALTNQTLIRSTWLSLIGDLISPIFKPLNIPWQLSASLMYGYVFKEVILSSMAVLYGTSEEGVINVLHSALQLPSALALITFITFYSPCIATLVTETRIVGVRLTVINTIAQLLLALALSYIVYAIALLVV